MEQNEQTVEKEGNNNQTKTRVIHTTDLRTYMLMGVVAVCVLLAILIVMGFLAANSLPGSPLYSFKTDVIESMESSVALSNEAKAESQLTFLAKRLEETKKLSSGDAISPKALEDLQEQVTLRSTALYEALAADSENYTSQNALKIVRDYIGIASALEEITESDTRFGELGNFMEDQRREAVNVYQERVDRFVERATPEAIFSLIQAQLTEVTQELANASLSEETIDDAENYINRVSSSMSEGDFPRAINSISEAQRFIRIDTLGAYALASRFDTPEEDAALEETATGTQPVASSTATQQL